MLMNGIGNNFQGEFWTHVEYFPCHRPLVNGVLDEIQGILLHMHVGVSLPTPHL